MLSKIKFTSIFRASAKPKSNQLSPADNFLNDPDSCFCDARGYAFDWSENLTLFDSVFSLQNMHLISQRKTVGYLISILVNKKLGTASVNHFATHEKFVRMGIGGVIAASLSKQLQARYQTRALVFRESSIANPAYAHFFRSLGATEHQEKRCATWIWKFGPLDLTDDQILGSLPH